jgi:toxin YoeB
LGKYWFDEAWADYVFWQTQDKKTLVKLNKLIRDIERNGNDGIGKPEPLSGELSGWYSRHIDEKNRLIYRLKQNGTIEILQCRDHYQDK